MTWEDRGVHYPLAAYEGATVQELAACWADVGQRLAIAMREKE